MDKVKVHLLQRRGYEDVGGGGGCVRVCSRGLEKSVRSRGKA